MKTLGDYEARLRETELAVLRRASVAERMPDVRDILLRPSFVAWGARLQDMIWTVRRFRAAIFGVDDKRSGRSAFLHGDTEVEGDVGPKLYLDVTASAEGATTGGIRRVAEKLAQASRASGLVVPVVVDAGILLRGSRSGTPRPLTLRAGDCYVLIDHFWYSMANYRAIVARASAVGAKVVVCVYDLIPLLHPTMIETSFVETFRSCFAEIIASSDAIVTVSASSRDDIETYISEKYPLHGRAEVVWFHLGADATRAVSGAVRREIVDLCSGDTMFLSVGTLLPHKGHLVALAAFDDLWKREIPACYVILGRVDPDFRFIGEAIRAHPAFGTRLFWFLDATDAELDLCYKAASALIQPSIAEGFGLPIVEALHQGLPVVASDIAIFRELENTGIVFVPRCDSQTLARAIEDAATVPRTTRRVDDLGWAASLDQLVEAVRVGG